MCVTLHKLFIDVGTMATAEKQELAIEADDKWDDAPNCPEVDEDHITCMPWPHEPLPTAVDQFGDTGVIFHQWLINEAD